MEHLGNFLGKLKCSLGKVSNEIENLALGKVSNEMFTGVSIYLHKYFLFDCFNASSLPRFFQKMIMMTMFELSSIRQKKKTLLAAQYLRRCQVIFFDDLHQTLRLITSHVCIYVYICMYVSFY